MIYKNSKIIKKIILLILLSSSISIFYYTINDNSNISINNHTPLILFKLPRSGSSWLTQKLNE
jgi:hypothetical protein